MKTFFEWLEAVTEEEYDLGERLTSGVRGLSKYFKDIYFRENPEFSMKIENKLNQIRELLDITLTQGEQYSRKHLNRIAKNIAAAIRTRPTTPYQLGTYIEELLTILFEEGRKEPIPAWPGRTTHQVSVGRTRIG